MQEDDFYDLEYETADRPLLIKRALVRCPHCRSEFEVDDVLEDLDEAKDARKALLLNADLTPSPFS